MIYSDLFFQELEKENAEEVVQERIKNYNEHILPFYQSKGETEQFFGKEDVPISCRFFRHPQPVAKVLIVTGYNESYLKYAEFIKNLYELNVSVYCYDHRGQGHSGRFLNQNKRGFIDFFPNLVEDLSVFFQKVVADQNKNTPVFVLGHSTGGCVIATALCDKKINPAATILCAPMFEVMLTPWHFLEAPIYAIANMYSIFGLEKSYAFGQKDCIPFLPFDTNDVTHSKARFFIWRKHIFEIPEMQLGGPTFAWIKQAVSASRKIRNRGEDNLIPMTILQAEEDTVVRNSAQDLFANSCSAAQIVVCGHARHEILMEVDFIRNKALDVIKNIILK